MHAMQRLPKAHLAVSQCCAHNAAMAATDSIQLAWKPARTSRSAYACAVCCTVSLCCVIHTSNTWGGEGDKEGATGQVS